MSDIDVALPPVKWEPTKQNIFDAIMDAAADEAILYSPTFGTETLHITNIRHKPDQAVEFEARGRKWRLKLDEA